MIDREKVINKLADIYIEAYDRYVHSQYTQDKLLTLIDKTIPEALFLLRKQEPVIVLCKNCRHYDGFSWCERRGFGTNDEWYCADGEIND